MLIEIPAVDALCPHCQRLGRVDIPEPAPALPYWTVCAGEHGCGAGYQITALSVVARYAPGEDGHEIHVHTETQP